MARQFGLKATAAAAQSSAEASSSATLNPRESVSASNSISPVGSPASELAPQGAELPFSPASWRGGRGRRSISQD
jgi:hypothetical protein